MVRHFLSLVGPLVGAALVVLVVGPAAADPAVSPVQKIEKLDSALLGVMQDAQKLGYEGRYRALEPVLKDTFRLPLMAEVSAGPHWKTLTPEQRSALVDAFSRYTVATYAHRFDGFSGEKFEVLGEAPARGDAVLVKSQIIKSNGEPVALDYLMRKFDQGWQVIDVYLKGSISELATRRSEYSSVIGREGLQSLLARIDSVISGYASGTAD